MRSSQSKPIVVLIICISALGLLISLFFLIEIWRFRQPVSINLQSGLNKTFAILNTTDDGLEVIDQVVNNVYSTTLYLDDATKALADTIQSTNSFIDSAGTFIGQDLVNTITNTQQTLESAQASAQVIDNIMSTLSRVPLIGINYNPTIPLNTALGQVSASLNPFQGSLKSFQANLTTTRDNVQLFNDQLIVLDKNIVQINQNLESSKAVISDYHSQVIAMQTWVENAQSALPTWVNTTCWILTIVILWLMLIQSGILLQAIYQLTERANAPEAVDAK